MMDYYEYHYYIKDMTDVLKKQKESSESEEQNPAQKPNMKMPTFKQPSFKMPSMPRR